MTEIRNTTADMNAPDSTDRLLLILAGAGGETSRFIENQEHAGQQQLVRSELLPTDTHNNDAGFESVGFTFGKPLADDPMFRPATLPDGWAKQGSDHDMWSYVVDQLGRRRAAVFYKAAFYDRSADMHLVDIGEYVHCHLGGYGGFEQLITDDNWATPEAIAAAALKEAAHHQEEIERYTEWLEDERYGRADLARKYLPAEVERHAASIALAERFAGGTK